MFELSVASKYLIPRRRQLSVSIISLISVLVIALVVWLIVVFFSVTDGLEKSWVQKLTALTAPIRVTPTDTYYNSYYYLIDSISESSNYSHKTIREKLEATTTDPYNPEFDQEIPIHWATPDLNGDGFLKDPVKLLFSILNQMQGVPGLKSRDFELTATHMDLRLLRQSTVLHSNNIFGGTTQSALSYPAFLGNFETDNPLLNKILLPIETKDLNNFLFLLGTESHPGDENENVQVKPKILRERLNHFFNGVTIEQLQTRPAGWNIPLSLLPEKTQWEVNAILKDGQIIRLVIPLKAEQNLSLKKNLEEQGLTVQTGNMILEKGKVILSLKNEEPQVIVRPTFTLAGGSSFLAKLDPSSLSSAKRVDEIRFEVQINIQGNLLNGEVPLRGLEIGQANILSPSLETLSPWWVHQTQISPKESKFYLPKETEFGEGILLPKSFRDVGALVGDRGSLSYVSPTASLLQEQQIPVYVAGFYDPGIIPIGGKFILTNPEVTSLIRSSHQQDDKTAVTNGVNVHFNNFDQADVLKKQLLQTLREKGIHHYWNVETFREFEFTKAILQELQSQKNLFMLIAVVIILVACSNIISMLIILVNDKKMEIGILRSMGASSKSIAFIFGISGAFIGVIGSVIGILAAILTLHNLDLLVALLSRLQGHEMFNAHFYGQVLPSELSFEALSFVLFATVCLSLLAGIVPAIKACLLRPSQILRASGG